MPQTRPVPKTVQIVAWIVVAVVAILSLAPDRPELNFFDLPEYIQHIAAYFVMATTLCAAYPNHRLLCGGGLVLFGGCLEVLQTLSPGRAPSWTDVGDNLTGVILGVAVVGGIRRLHSSGFARPGR